TRRLCGSIEHFTLEMRAQRRAKPACQLVAARLCRQILAERSNFSVELLWSMVRLKCLLNGGQSPPASISRQGFAGKSLQSGPTFQLNCSGAFYA
ncbi:MAG: hypothetical protein LBU06_08995, partial [Desulfovibrio sp.]|nr:hypothetical protein [Desulfovibrio sp.]